MKLFFNIVFIGLVIAAGILVYRTPYYPCDTPLAYAIGAVDPRFGLSAGEVAQYAEDAANIWDASAGKKLLSNVQSSGMVTVNFEYDRRTELNNSVNKMQSQVSRENATLQQKMDSYDADVSAFEQRLSDLNATIKRYNRQGGAPPEVYPTLIKEQDELRNEGVALNARARELNVATRDYNSQVDSLNQNVQALNQAVSQKPEEGLYDGMKNTITLYFASSRQEFVHTLAHEFGHALGMDHTDDPKSIMYPYSTAYQTVTPADLQQLASVCRTIPLPEHWIQVLRDKIIILLQPATD